MELLCRFFSFHPILVPITDFDSDLYDVKRYYKQQVEVSTTN